MEVIGLHYRHGLVEIVHTCYWSPGRALEWAWEAACTFQFCSLGQINIVGGLLTLKLTPVPPAPVSFRTLSRVIRLPTALCDINLQEGWGSITSFCPLEPFPFQDIPADA